MDYKGSLVWKYLLVLLAVFFTNKNSFAQFPIPYYNSPIINGTVYAVEADSQHIYIGGQLSYIGSPTGSFAALNFNGNIPDIGYCRPKGLVRCAIPDGTGGWFIGGDFTVVVVDSATEIVRNRLAHILPGGSLDLNWNPSANNPVYCLLRSGGVLFAGGSFTSINGNTRNRLAMLSASGTGALDPLWNPNVAGSFVGRLYQDGMNLYIGGNFTNVGGQVRNNLARVTANAAGALDAAWIANTNGNVLDMSSWGGQLIVAGAFTTINGNPAAYLAKLSMSNAGLVNTWNPAPASTVTSILADEGKLYVSGNFLTVGGSGHIRLARVDTGGTGICDAWNPTLGSGASVMLRSGQYLYLGGGFTTVNNISRNYLARLDTAGAGYNSLDSAWYPIANSWVACMEKAGSQLVTGGNFSAIGGLEDDYLVRVTHSGLLDHEWRPKPNAAVYALLLKDNSVFAGGDFTVIDGQLINKLTKLNKSDGHKAAGWNMINSSNLRALTYHDNKLYTGGAGGVRRIDPLSGLMDPNWYPGYCSMVYTMDHDNDHLYFGGDFTSVDMHAVPNLARASLLGTGAVDTTWIPAPNNGVLALLLSGNSVIAGGAFTQMGLLNRNRLARVSKAGVGIADPLWNPNADDRVRALQQHPNGLFVGGEFTVIGAQSHKGIACLKPNGLPYTTWNPGIYTLNHIWDLNSIGNELFVAGSFSTTSVQRQYELARYSVDDMCFPVTVYINDAICQGDTFAFNGQYLLLAGNYSDTLLNVDGCDSIVNLQLTVIPHNTDTITASACYQYTLNGVPYVQSGTYQQNLQTPWGCDSTVVLLLTLAAPDTSVVQNGAFLSAAAGAQTYQWIQCAPFQVLNGEINQVFTATANGEYAVIVSNANCADTSSCFSVQGLGIRDRQMAIAPEFFPNPVGNYLHFRYTPVSADLSITITQLNGQIVYEKIFYAGNISTIDTGKIAPGTYMLVLKDGKKLWTRLINKE